MQLGGLPWGDSVLINFVQLFEHGLRFEGREFVYRIILDDRHCLLRQLGDAERERPSIIADR